MADKVDVLAVMDHLIRYYREDQELFGPVDDAYSVGFHNARAAVADLIEQSTKARKLLAGQGEFIERIRQCGKCPPELLDDTIAFLYERNALIVTGAAKSMNPARFDNALARIATYPGLTATQSGQRHGSGLHERGLCRPQTTAGDRMSNINQTNLGSPPPHDPFMEQAVDEVAAVFDQIPDSVVVALSASMGQGWYAKAQDAWCDQRAARLRIEDDRHRMESQEPCP